MAKPTKAKFLRTLKIAILAAGLPLLLCQSGWTQSPTSTPIDSSVKSYINQLTDNDAGNNETALQSLKQMGRTTVAPLVKELQSNQAQVRRCIVGILGTLGSDAKDAVNPLILVLQNDSDFQVRRDTAQTLGKIGSPAQDAITPLIASLENDKDQGVRVYAGLALAKIAPTNPSVLEAWSKALKSNDLNIQKMAAYGLADSLSTLEKSYLLEPILSDVRTMIKTDLRWQTQLVGAIVLGGSTQDIKTALSKINELLQDQNQEIRNQAIAELGYIGELLLRQAEKLTPAKMTQATEGLNQSIEILNALKHDLEVPGINMKQDVQEINQLITSLRGTIEVFTAVNNKYLIEQIVQWLQKYWLVPCLLFLVISLLSCWSMFLWLRPLWLKQISEALSKVEKTSLPLPQWAQVLTLTRKISLIVFFHYHPRVLDAWVEANIATAQREFITRRNLKDYSIHIPVSVVLNDQDIADLTSQHLQPEFSKKLVRVLIWGEGGSGKTSLAYELAWWAMSSNLQQRLCQHRMLPIFLEAADDLDFTATNKNVLVEAIQGQLKALLTEPKPLFEEFLEQILKQQRLLVIVDGLSEMSKATRQLIHPEYPNFPVNALLVTSRIKERLGGVNSTTLKTMRVTDDHLSQFMGSYLTSQGKRELFTDQEFFEACSHLTAIVGHRDITVLLAKLYVEQMIAVKAGTIADDIPDNIPALMLKYLKQLNQTVAENQFKDRIIQHDAKIIAWECLQHTYHPTSAKRDTILTALGYEDAESHLDYLEKRLRVIQTSGISEDYIRFSLDPLAEYLASLYLVECYKDNEQKWYSFLEKLDARGESESIQGFLLALKDCCLINKEMLQLPDFLIEKLTQLKTSEISE